MNFNKIGYFQLDNLLQSRVPCLLVVYDNIDLAPWYNSVIKHHLEAISMNLEPHQGLDVIQSKNFTSDHSIIVIDRDGSKAQMLVEQLEEQGFTNVFYVTGGFEQLSKERSEA